MTVFKNILYVMSSGLDNVRILGQVIRFAEAKAASLTVIDIIDALPRSSRMLVTAVPTADLRDHVVRARLDELEQLVSRLGTGSLVLRPLALFGNPAREIVREAADGSYDLVIKSRGKAGTDRYLQKNCGCPVWVLQPDDYDDAGQLVTTGCPAAGRTNAVSHAWAWFS